MPAPILVGWSAYRLDRNKQIGCDECRQFFTPLRNFSVLKYLLGLPLLFMPVLYWRKHFVCPRCRRKLHFKMHEFRV